MATAAYRDWVRQGRPTEYARPVTEYKAALKAAGWEAIDIGTIGDEEHLQAEVPQDHTPFSATGWPDPNPYPVVHAIDVMHHPDQGEDVGPLVAYWIAEARAGHTPWVKYIVWQAQAFSVRSDWVAQPARGHFDHAHVSFRTDHTDTSVGQWSIIGKGNPVTTSETGRAVWKEHISSPSLDFHAEAAEWLKYTVQTDRKVDQLIGAVETLNGLLATLTTHPIPIVDPAQLAQALAGNDEFISVLAASIADRLPGSDLPNALREALEGLTIRVGSA